MEKSEELANLADRDFDGRAVAAGSVVEVRVSCSSPPGDVLSRIVEALSAVIEHQNADADEAEYWKTILPEWLREKFAPPATREQSEEWLRQWRSLSGQAQKDFELQNWTMGSWIHWFTNEERHWYWLGSRVTSDEDILIYLRTSGYPFPWQSLQWLIIQAGGVPEIVE